MTVPLRDPARLLFVVTALCAAQPGLAAPPLTAADYDRAAAFLGKRVPERILNEAPKIKWLGAQDRFVFRRELAPQDAEFMVVDAATGKMARAFDHERIAAALSRALKRSIAPTRLPFEDFTLEDDGDIAVQVAADRLQCSAAKRRCSIEAKTAESSGPPALPSPDGRFELYRKGDDLWLREAGAADGALTQDGTAGYAWGAVHGYDVSRNLLAGTPLPPVGLWSPDGRYVLTHRLDEREVAPLHWLQSAPPGQLRPRLHTLRYAFANETLARSELYLFDVAERRRIRVDLPPLALEYVTAMEGGEAWWSPDGKRLYVVTRERYAKAATVHLVEPATGGTRALFTERADTYMEVFALMAEITGLSTGSVTPDGDILWLSDRDGHRHLYLYDGVTGALKRQLTRGAWEVAGLARYDVAARVAYVAGTGREAGDPYYQHYYAVALDSDAIRQLTPEDAHHVSHGTAGGFAPSGKYFVDTWSTVSQPPVTVLRRNDGSFVAEIARADISAWLRERFVPPERFQAVAADGKTPLYGTIMRPSGFDPKARYPVLDSLYPGPQTNRVRPGFMANLRSFDVQAYAELGFIVITLDGRGTPGRSRAFLDAGYGRLATAGHLDDHVAVFRQLAPRYPEMDFDRVGAFGASGGGYAAVRAMLAYPDVYKVGVAAAGNHDQRLYLPVWGETYNGPVVGNNYLDAANARLADRLQGKLLLIHGEMDANVHPAHTQQLADALMRANKDFEVLYVPNVGHGFSGYAQRRAWDFLVRHLLGREPPREYLLRLPDEAN